MTDTLATRVAAGYTGSLRSIAVLDDSIAILELMQDVLEDDGYEAILLRTAESAYPILREVKPALLILDMNLQTPDSGWWLLQQLKSDPTTKDIPIIVYTGATWIIRDEQERFSSFNCRTLAKPFNIDELLGLVDSCISESLTRKPPTDAATDSTTGSAWSSPTPPVPATY